MGYRHQRKIYTLRFEAYDGLRVTARSVSVGELLKILKLADQMTSTPGEEQIRELFDWFTRAVVGWNLEGDDGKALPVATEVLLDQDFDFALAMVMAWVQAVSSVTMPPLAQVPPGGTPGGTAADPAEAGLPMESPAGT